MIWHIIVIILLIILIWILIQKNIKQIYTPKLFKNEEKLDKKILTYNIQKFPWALKSLGDKEISNLIHSHSIILFQECFNEAYDSLESHYPDYYICRGVLKGLNLMNSGLVIMSRFPILNVKFYEYKSSNPFSFDYFSEKGFLVATIKVENKNIKIINTHLQSSDFYRYDKYALSQIEELLKYLDHLNDMNEEYIVGGDFNIDIGDFNDNKYKELIKSPSKATIYINLTTSHTSNVYKKGYESFIFDYFITPFFMSDPIVINSDYSDHNPVSSCFYF